MVVPGCKPYRSLERGSIRQIDPCSLRTKQERLRLLAACYEDRHQTEKSMTRVYVSGGYLNVSTHGDAEIDNELPGGGGYPDQGLPPGVPPIAGNLPEPASRCVAPAVVVATDRTGASRQHPAGRARYNLAHARTTRPARQQPARWRRSVRSTTACRARRLLDDRLLPFVGLALHCS